MPEEKAEAMPIPSTAENIQIQRYERPQGPFELRQEVTQDSYILSSPLVWGETKLIANGRVVHDGAVRPGMLRLMSPGDSATITGTVEKGAYAVVPGALFRQLAAPPRQDELRQILRIAPLTQPDRRIHSLFTMLLSADELEKRHHSLMVGGLTQALVAILLEHHHKPTNARPSRSTGLSEIEFRRSVDYARSTISTGLELEEWAQVLGMSAAEFARRFHFYTGQAPYAWYLNLRIEKAKELLRDHRIPLVEVALSLGFCSQSHFHETFRRRIGVTPGFWRMQKLRDS
jgi:AraC family transcriptional regulator